MISEYVTGTWVQSGRHEPADPQKRGSVLAVGPCLAFRSRSATRSNQLLQFNQHMLLCMMSEQISVGVNGFVDFPDDPSLPASFMPSGPLFQSELSSRRPPWIVVELRVER